MSFNAYSIAKATGYLKTNGKAVLFPEAKDLLQVTKRAGFCGLELPLDYYFSRLDTKNASDFFDCAALESIQIFPCIENFTVDFFEKNAAIFAEKNLKTIRIKMPHLGKTFYGGNRYSSSHFSESLDVFSDQLNLIDPLLNDFGLSVAIENHQDLDLLDLVKLCETSKYQRRQITWDVGNSLATMRTPYSFFDGAKYWISNIHLKDYRLFRNDNQLILKRCVLGQGVVDPNEIFRLLNHIPFLKNISMEMAAHIDRTADIFTPAYLSSFNHSKNDKESFFQFVDKNAEHCTRDETIPSINLSNGIDEEVEEAFMSSIRFLESSNAIC